MRAQALRYALALATAVALAGCTQGDGPVVERTREIGTFSRIDAGAGVQVNVTIGPAGPIVVRAQENIQDNVSTEVRSDGTLRIEANDDFVAADPVVLEVTTPHLDSVTLNGGAAVELAGLEADAFEVSLSGGARATISGTASSVSLSATGGSTASLGELASVTVSVTLDGGVTANVRASVSVAGTASGGAKLKVSGEASIDVATSGGAEVNRG